MSEEPTVDENGQLAFGFLGADQMLFNFEPAREGIDHEQQEE
jgi:hypothetical protein